MAVDTLETAAPDTTTTAPATPVRSRRALLTAALAGLGGLFASRLGTPEPAAAAAGDPLIIGNTTNTAGTANTTLTTASAGTALLVTQNGTGAALRGSAVGPGSIAGFFTAANGTGISGVTGKPTEYGVFGSNDGAGGTGAAIRADGNLNDGLSATTDSATKVAIKASNSASGGIAAQFESTNGVGGWGVRAQATGVGVRGISSGDASGVWGSSAISVGVRADSNTGTGVSGISNTQIGVWGVSFGVFGTGVRGQVTGPSAHGVVGVAEADSVTTSAVAGFAVGDGYAGYFEGKVQATGGYTSPTPATVRLDHPLDPANQYLNQFGVTSDELLNEYGGVVELDSAGAAEVELPAWFEALNAHARYQLTPIGSAMPDLHVAARVAGRRFQIAGGSPGGEVSWLLVARRSDQVGRRHARTLEQAKPAGERGLYQDPALYGQPAAKGIGHAARHRVHAFSAGEPALGGGQQEG